MQTNLPNFLIVGAAKSGTTSLYHYLKTNPQIYLSSQRKELRFFSDIKEDFQGPHDERFNSTIVRDIETYKSFFEDVKDETAVGDISPDYLFYYENSIKKIKRYLGNPKIIIILRNPVDRAFSHWSHYRRDGKEDLSFEEALETEQIRKEKNWEWGWRYKEVGLYYDQVKAYMENFTDVKVYLQDELHRDPAALVKEIFGFLGVDDTFVPPNLNEKFNVSGLPKSRYYHNFFRRDNLLKSLLRPIFKMIVPDETERQKIVNRLLQRNLEKMVIDTETRKKLQNFYKNDILKLQDLIGKDLTKWIAE